jgi:hypothetical protein
MPLHILDAVEDHVFVASADKVEKTLPRYVAGLNDGNAPRLSGDSTARVMVRTLQRYFLVHVASAQSL